MAASGMNELKGYAVGIAILAVVVLMTMAIVTGVKNTNLVDNSTADNFITGLTYFGLFAAILVLAAIGFVVIRMFTQKKGGGGL